MRLFIAIDVPAQILDRLSNLMENLSAAGARCVGKDSMHVTVLFIGEVEDSKLEKIEIALDELRCGSFECSLNGIGSFGDKKPNIVFAKFADGDKELVDINRQLKVKLAALGFRTESRSYTPHFTLARTTKKTDFEKLGELAAKNKHLDIGRFACNEIKLKRSILSGAGPVYIDLFVKQFSAGQQA